MSIPPSKSDPVIDFAGSGQGGARRFREEFDRHIEAKGVGVRPNVLGQNKQLTVSHLVARELKARGIGHVIATNNVSFALVGDYRTVLLRNALHFASPDELELAMGARNVDRQVPVVRAMAHRADRVIVPCSAMADRVVHYEPKLASKIVVKFHPVSRPAWSFSPPPSSLDVLLPSLPAPYKQLEEKIKFFLDATKGTSIRLLVTADEGEMKTVGADHRVELIGRLDPAKLNNYWAMCGAVYFPTLIESFGYPLAEARCGGRSIIAIDSAQNREIAGGALRPFRPGDVNSLTEAVHFAFEARPDPDPDPFNPQAYFRTLLSP